MCSFKSYFTTLIEVIIEDEETQHKHSLEEVELARRPSVPRRWKSG